MKKYILMVTVMLLSSVNFAFANAMIIPLVPGGYEVDIITKTPENWTLAQLEKEVPKFGFSGEGVYISYQSNKIERLRGSLSIYFAENNFDFIDFSEKFFDLLDLELLGYISDAHEVRFYGRVKGSSRHVIFKLFHFQLEGNKIFAYLQIFSDQKSDIEDNMEEIEYILDSTEFIRPTPLEEL